MVARAEISAAAHDEATAERARAATAEILAWGHASFPGLRDGKVEVWTLPWPPSQEVRDAGLLCGRSTGRRW